MVALPAWSAEKSTASPPPAAQKSPEGPVAIEVTDVIPRSVRALQRLREIREKLDTDNSVSVVEAGLPAFVQQLDEWWKAEAATIKKMRSVQRINDVLWQWRLQEAQIAAWNGLLTTSSKEWSAEEESLNRVLGNWQATQLALKKGAPAAARDKIAEVLREGEATRRLFQEKTAQLVAVQGKLVARMESLNEIRQEIEAARQQSSVDLMYLDSPPLWRAFASAETTEVIATQANEVAAQLYNDAINFLQRYRIRLFLHLVLFLGMAILFSRLRRMTQAAGDIKPTAAEAIVLEHSFASALLLAMFGAPLIYPGASPQILRIGVIPGIAPILILLPAVLSPRLRRGFYLLTFIFLLDYLRYFLPSDWLFVRLLLLSAALLGAVGTIWMLKTRAIESAVSYISNGEIRSLLGIALVLCFAGSVGANVIGNLTLAEMLVSPTIRILCLGVVIRLIAVVTTTFALMALRSRLASLSRMFRDRGETVALNLHRLANFIAWVLWILLSLYSLGVLGNVQSAFEQFFELRWKVGAAEISVRDFVSFIVVITGAYLVSRLLRVLLAEEIFPRFHLPRGVPDALELLARYGVLLFGFLLALTSAGVNLSQVTLALSALGVGIGFGLQNIVNNFVCGLILVFEHPIQVGDLVEVGTHFGRVQRIGFRASVVRTMDGAEVIIPNSELIGTKVINWSLSDQLRRITIEVPVPIGTDADRVIGILEKVARSQSGVMTYPAPGANLEQFGASSLKFLLRCWARSDGFGTVRDGLTVAIDKAFQEAGIQIPFPQTDVHVHWSDNPSVGIAPTEKPK
jgi:small-conductance mechanosensitive channel